MSAEPFVIERTYNAAIDKVWGAITNPDKMREWYFNVSDFKTEVGFEFEFTGGDDIKEYRHLCSVTKVVPGATIAYSWQYDEYEGSLSEHGRALRMIPKVPLPKKDPVYGADGPLRRLWARKKRVAETVAMPSGKPTSVEVVDTTDGLLRGAPGQGTLSPMSYPPPPNQPAYPAGPGWRGVGRTRQRTASATSSSR